MWRPLLHLLVLLLLLLFFLLLQLPHNAASQAHRWEDYKHQEDYKHGRQGSEPLDRRTFCSWKCLLFTLQWPGGFCQSLDKEDLCRIPQSINNWTIHGLWPLRVKDSCTCWPMFRSDVQELEAELTEQWPSLLKIKSSFHFWKEEWQKHGVHAACVEGLNSPLRYFNICLKLRGLFDIHKLLKDAGITPSCERLYKVAEVDQVLVPHLGDKHEIQCVTDDEGREVWFQVKILLSRNLTLGCDHHGDADGDPGWGSSPAHPCPPQVPFYFLPIDHERPRRPCG
ncbi:ribonuclease T2-like [Pempheris klunzingeri]|uniref:ribonuclease T2-like n=1 Tax=Pempheris klunzingeri TaxID=3127111 RepID=UPI0039812769